MIRSLSQQRHSKQEKLIPVARYHICIFYLGLTIARYRLANHHKKELKP